MLVLLIFSCPVSGAENGDRFHNGIPAQDIVLVNHSEINSSTLEKFQKTPEPVTIIHAEVSETALPGPRYMAFGPSTIGISVSPVIPGTLVVLAFIGIGVWSIWTDCRKRREPDNE